MKPSLLRTLNVPPAHLCRARSVFFCYLNRLSIVRFFVLLCLCIHDTAVNLTSNGSLFICKHRVVDLSVADVLFALTTDLNLGKVSFLN